MNIDDLKNNIIIKRIRRIPFIISVLTIIILIYNIGFVSQSEHTDIFLNIYIFSLSIGVASMIGRYLLKETQPKLIIKILDIILFIFLSILIFQHLGLNLPQWLHLFKHPYWLHLAIILVFLRELSAIKLNIKGPTLNPAQLFIVSFLSLVVAGSILLMLPNATHTHIKTIDALFTSTSAVCVTGLIVVDTGTFFTQFGQIIILLLIQAGGIGIMTFTSYFSYFFKGESSFQSQFTLREITNVEKISEVFVTLKKILLITFSIEGVGALLIYWSIDPKVITSLNERLFFSVFHSISGFCNAGFSTLQNSLAEGPYQFNYPMHIIIACLIIIGGIGFPIVLNILNFLKVKILNFTVGFYNKAKQQHTPRLINTNTHIVLITTLALIVGGTILFYLFEYNNTLSNHSSFGKLVTAFFGSVTTRTAGFNTVDTSLLSSSTIIIFIFLMWVGASPASTGGGIKTSSLAIALLNAFTIAKGKARIEIYKREISTTSVHKAFAIIILSIFVIITAILCISFFDSEESFMSVVFECVSAYSTVGLSRGITAGLSSASKVVLILTMFLGRVSTLTLLISIIKKRHLDNSRYPSDNILIN